MSDPANSLPLSELRTENHSSSRLLRYVRAPRILSLSAAQKAKIAADKKEKNHESKSKSGGGKNVADNPGY
jgi:hypothetical protein